MYKVEWTKQAEEDLNKIDRTIANKIAYRVENYLVQNPQQLGKRLSGVWKGRLSYRYDDYRIIYTVREQELIILVVKAGHRKEVY